MEKIQHEDCPVTYCMQKIGGKWKPILIHLIRKGANRFGILEKGIDGITKQMLTKATNKLTHSLYIFARKPSAASASFLPLYQSSVFKSTCNNIRQTTLSTISSSKANQL